MEGADLVLMGLFQNLTQCEYLVDDGLTRSETALNNLYKVASNIPRDCAEVI